MNKIYNYIDFSIEVGLKTTNPLTNEDILKNRTLTLSKEKGISSVDISEFITNRKTYAEWKPILHTITSIKNINEIMIEYNSILLDLHDKDNTIDISRKQISEDLSYVEVSSSLNNIEYSLSYSDKFDGIKLFVIEFDSFIPQVLNIEDANMFLRKKHINVDFSNNDIIVKY